MSRKPLNKPIDNQYLADVGKANKGKLLTAALLKVTKDGKIDSTTFNLGKFLLNPSSWEETKNPNWIAHNVPGQSDPVFQWVSSGPRVINFEALVTQDSFHYLNPEKSNLLEDLAGAALNIVGSIASSFAGVNIPPIGDLFGGGDSAAGNQLSIAPYLGYYRSLVYPTYQTGKLMQSPPLCVLAAGETFSKIPLNLQPGGAISVDTDLWIVTGMKINVTKQLPNLSPMEARVNIQLTQYTLAPKSTGDLLGLPADTGSASSGIIDTISGLFNG